MPKQKWQFITTTNGKLNDENTQRIVRETAMRDYRRNERIARMQEFESMQAKGSISQKSEETRRQGPGEATDEHNVSLANVGAVRLHQPGNRLDPFGSTELPVNVEDQTLFSYCEYIDIRLRKTLFEHRWQTRDRSGN